MLVFIDTEVNKNQKIVDIGCVSDSNEYLHTTDPFSLQRFLKKAKYIIGHNIVKHDLIYLRRLRFGHIFRADMTIDTLFLSTLLFPEKPYHALVKDDKIESDSINNPVNDASNAKKLFQDIELAFNHLSEDMKDIFYSLLKDQEGFSGFFSHMKFNRKIRNLELVIKTYFDHRICSNAQLSRLIKNNPIELAYALSLINTNDVESLLPPWVLKNFSYVEDILIQLRNTACYQGCSYCDSHLNPKIGLKKFFDYDEFRSFDGVPLQASAVESALKGESLVTVFPTGGGKSLTFQLPALMNRENTRGLTVVISPLQSLMKDQVDTLEEKSITSAVTINGLLDPIQRANAIERVRDGSASILYIAPESLRSKTIENLLIGRHVVRFVIDEAHCFSTWGHDFRVDYLYIGEFIKKLQEIKNSSKPIAVSCFTATAKPNVIEDIETYFKNKLNLNMKIFKTTSSRKNLKYKVYEVKDDSEKYGLMRRLIEQEDTPTIIYTARRKTVEALYKKLTLDKFSVSQFHGGLETEVKVAEQDKFMSGVTQIMVATSAFGMGVDKSDIGCIIHYEISDSLENYIQESGRAGRDQKLNANCYILYNEDDLDKHFELLNSSRLNIKEIQSVWKAIKDLTKLRDSVSQSALEIARMAGWDESIHDLQTKVTTAIAALEDAGYLKRGLNSPRLYANSILVKSVIEANAKIEQSRLFIDSDLINAKRIIKLLISSKYKSRAGSEEAESRIDYISDILGIEKKEVIKCINLLREAKILTDDKDLKAHIKRNTKPTSALKTLENYDKLMVFLVRQFTIDTRLYNVKMLNELASGYDIESTTKDIRIALNFLEIIKLISTDKEGKDNLRIKLDWKIEDIESRLEELIKISTKLVTYLFNKSFDDTQEPEENLVSFSVLELKDRYEKLKGMLDSSITIKQVEETLYFLQKIKILQIEGGFMVIYSPLNIERIIKDNHRQYTKIDFKKLEDHYKVKMKQIHIVGDYAKKMIEDYQSALTFVNDYFSYPFDAFLNKYFSGTRRKEIDNSISPKKFKQLFGTLTPEQLKVILDKDHKRIAVAAGPGSGKTKLLVHKLASIIFTEEIKHEQLLMLTFSRTAVTEFKSRLLELIGPVANYIDIMTFHSFAFDLLGKVGDLEKSQNIIEEAIELINNDKADAFKITRAVLVIDEAQDMDEHEYQLVKSLIDYNENLKVIAVGDDDQNIFEFRGSSSKYFRDIAEEEKAFYELPLNFRSKKNLVDFTNQVALRIKNRLKTIPIKSFSQHDGSIRITRHMNHNFVIPIVEEIKSLKLQGNTCIITRTNDQAVQITGLLNKNNIQARLIQTNDEFRLFHLHELYYFYQYIDKMNSVNITDQIWTDALQELNKEFAKSDNYEIALKALNTFRISTGTSMYISDLKEFLYESSISDFYTESKLMVSTFHKAKGKEFDNVVILYDNGYTRLKDDELRTLYVGLTRAKTNLYIHVDGDIFDSIIVEDLSRFIDESIPENPDRLSMVLNHKDINLGYSNFVQRSVLTLRSGMKLEIEDNNLIYQGLRVGKFSKKAQSDIVERLSRGYHLTEAVVRHVVYWYDKDKSNHYAIVLPELIFDYSETQDSTIEENLDNQNKDIE